MSSPLSIFSSCSGHRRAGQHTAGHNSAGRMRNNVRQGAGVKNARKMLRMATREYAEECLSTLIRKITRQGACARFVSGRNAHLGAGRCTNAHRDKGKNAHQDALGRMSDRAHAHVY